MWMPQFQEVPKQVQLTGSWKWKCYVQKQILFSLRSAREEYTIPSSHKQRADRGVICYILYTLNGENQPVHPGQLPPNSCLHLRLFIYILPNKSVWCLGLGAEKGWRDPGPIMVDAATYDLKLLLGSNTARVPTPATDNGAHV